MTSSAQLGRSIAALESGEGVLIVVPSMTFDSDELAKIRGAVHFEERMLWLLQVLRNPLARVIYVTSERLPDRLVDYSVSLTGVTGARERVEMISCEESSPIALTYKILERPDIQQRIRDGVQDNVTAVMMCHVATAAEEELATALGVPLFACPPSLVNLGTKSASRKAFCAADVPLPDGEEDLRDRDDVLKALIALSARNPKVRRAVIKLNDSFAGGGNAVLDYPTVTNGDLAAALSEQLDRAAFADGETPDRYFSALARMGGIVEEYIEGTHKTSPSAQCIIAPDGSVRVSSTHEQILGGAVNQTYFGCRFPADDVYNVTIAESAQRVAIGLAANGVIGHISIDFVCRETDRGWEHYALEVNLRMGGATAPISFLESATGSQYDAAAGRFVDGYGRSLFYKSADRIQSDEYRSLSSGDLLDAADSEGLHFETATGSGAVFYMLGALATVGKLGLVAIDHSPQASDRRYDQTLRTLDTITART